MQLVSMDVDRYGTNQRCQLGPFIPGLNAICGPRGSGKTALLTWLRQVAVEERGPQAIPYHLNAGVAQGPVSGSVQVCSRQQTYRLATDRQGRMVVEQVNRTPAAAGNGAVAGYSPQIDYSSRSVFSQAQKDVFSGLLAASGAADTESSLQELAHRIGLDSQSDRLGQEEQRRQLSEREYQLVGWLRDIQEQRLDRERLRRKREELTEELNAARREHSSGVLHRSEVDFRRLEQRLHALQRDLQQNLDQIQTIESEIKERQAELKVLEVAGNQVDIGDSYRQQLQQLDDRLNRWRQTLRDLKSHREQIEHAATDARLDDQLGDQLSSTKQSDPRAALRSLEAQILKTRRQLDHLIGRFGAGHPEAYWSGGYQGHAESADDWSPRPARTRAELDSRRGSLDSADVRYSGASFAQRGESATGGSDYSWAEPQDLPLALRSMQKDLYEVCQQLARQESHSASANLKAQVQQLERCETELLHSVERLIEQRGTLLRRIADEQHLSLEQLTLAFGDWCQCHDHPHLKQWLLSDESKPGDAESTEISPSRAALLEQIERLEAERKEVMLRADECRRQLRELDSYRVGRVQPTTSAKHRDVLEIQRDLDRVHGDLDRLDRVRDWETELSDVRHRMRALSQRSPEQGAFREAVRRHLSALTNGWLTVGGQAPQWNGTSRRYDTFDGVITEEGSFGFAGVPDGLVRTAMRLAIVEAMAKRGETVALLLDESLDGLTADMQSAAIAHLSRVTGFGQQVIVLTSDERVAEIVRQHHGAVSYMRESAPEISNPLDINSQLSAYANEHEADKWYRPAVPAKPRRDRQMRGEYYLNENSLIEDSPSIDPTAAARCRAVGVDRIGDLLDVDPHWLADNVRIDGISGASIARWQAESRLLCSVKNLLPFDARVLVGAGVTTPMQLAEMHPSQLLDRVERFLATDHGRRILRSGSSYELSRITTWIASAKSGTGSRSRTNATEELGYGFGESGTRTRLYTGDDDYDYSNSEYDHGEGEQYEFAYDSQHSKRNFDRSDGYGSRGSSGRDSRRGETGRRGSSNRGSASRRRGSRSARNGASGSSRQSSRSSRQEHSRSSVRIASGHSRDNSSSSSERTLKFYLELADPVVDAPSIGPRMAERLEKHGVYTVENLLTANPDILAEKLNHRRIDADLIRAWQEQARLVCRIPNLRGHDAQLLVACDLTSPEELAESDAESVLSMVTEVAESAEGQRILRGGKEPDLEEVQDWISWAASCRSIHAA